VKSLRKPEDRASSPESEKGFTAKDAKTAKETTDLSSLPLRPSRPLRLKLFRRRRLRAIPAIFIPPLPLSSVFQGFLESTFKIENNADRL
jgi:hypothetical protein